LEDYLKELKLSSDIIEDYLKKLGLSLDIIKTDDVKKMQDILKKLEKLVDNKKFKQVVADMLMAMSEQRFLSGDENTRFINMLKKLSKDNIFNSLLAQIKSSQEIRDFMRDTISEKICKKRSRFAAAVEACDVCYEKYTGKHNTDEEIKSCNKDNCRAPVNLKCIHGKTHVFCHTCVAILTDKDGNIKCPTCRCRSKSPSRNAQGAPLSSRGAPLSSRGAPLSSRGAPLSSLTLEGLGQTFGTGSVGMLLRVYVYGFIIVLIFGISLLIRENM
jgi:hypothetical protein